MVFPASAPGPGHAGGDPRTVAESRGPQWSSFPVASLGIAATGLLSGPGAGSDKEFKPPEEAKKARVAAQRLEVGILPQSCDVAVPQLQCSLQGGEGRIDHAQDRVGAREVIPGDRIIRNQADQTTVELERPRILSPGGKIVPLDPEGIHKKRILLEDPPQEVNLEVALGLLTQSTRGDLGRRAFRSRIACSII